MKIHGTVIALVCGVLLFLIKMFVGQLTIPYIVFAAVIPGILKRKHGLFYSLGVAVTYTLFEVMLILSQSLSTDTRTIMYPAYLHTVVLIMLAAGYGIEKVIDSLHLAARVVKRKN